MTASLETSAAMLETDAISFVSARPYDAGVAYASARRTWPSMKVFPDKAGQDHRFLTECWISHDRPDLRNFFMYMKGFYIFKLQGDY